jgi:predicted ATPase
MLTNKYGRGSEWRKWDLHIHTPKSIIQKYGGDTPEIWEKFITDLENLPDDFKVIGINDYIFLDGYKEVLKYKQKGRLANIDLILPVVELRVDKFCSLGDEAWKKVNLHIIFSDQLKVEEIEAQFLNAIQHCIKISPDIEGIEFQGVATREYLSEIGKKIKDSSTVEINGSDLKVGFWNITFDYKVVKDITNGYFQGNCLTAVGKSEWDTMRWDGSAAIKKTVINDANFSLVSLEKPEDYQKHIQALDKQKVRSCLLDCSDAHEFSTSVEKDRIGNCFLWVKADATFEGLKQLSNDKGRIFVGDKPPLLKRFESNKTKFIDRLRISKIAGSSLSECWFDNFDLQLNPSMVAIIGNKGGGKSAIADAIGLVGNTPNFEYFSFLTHTKFRTRKPINKSSQFEGAIVWADGSIDSKLLSENPDSSSFEKVKYIPQGFLERLCNKGIEDEDIFEPELRKVIFSHLSETERLGKSNLNEILDYQTEIINGVIDDLKKEINSVNKTIIDLEKKQSDNFRKGIEEKLKEKENELLAHEAAKPANVEPPTDPQIVERNKVLSDDIEKKRGELKLIDENITAKQDQLKLLRLEVAELDKILQVIAAFESQYLKIKDEITPSLLKHDLLFEDTITLTINRTRIAGLIQQKNSLAGQITTDLGTIDNGGLLSRKFVLGTEINSLLEKLDEHSKKYQKYVDEIKLWQEKKSNILGTENKDETIAFLNAQIEYLNTKLTSELEVQYLKRKEIVKKLYQKKEEAISLYRNLFKPVSEFISRYGEALENYTINFDVDYKINGLSEKFFDHISLGAKGSFLGNPGGIEKLNHIIESHELKTESGILAFLDELILNLRFDQRPGWNTEKREIENQLKKGYSVYDLYSFLFSLEYLEPEYKLRLGLKNISQLSPGERGALLLIFYLTLDQDDIPLIIDQPEENLDNQSVFKILVQFINNAKDKRQIIIVTHNPNLAVACNAEQIVHINIDKMNKNTVEFVSGSLENKITNNAVIDILEGTFPALNTRTATYKVIDRS